MSTPNEPQNPYGAEPPKDPDATPQYPAAPPPPPAAPQYPSAPQYPGAAPQAPQAPGAPQYPSAPQYGAPTPYPAAAPYGSAPGGYPPAGYGAVYPKNNLAVWSLVLGILTFVLCGVFSAVAAVIVGYKARKAVAAGEANNGGMATAGIILGWVGIALSILGIAFFLLIIATGGWADIQQGWEDGYNSGY